MVYCGTPWEVHCEEQNIVFCKVKSYGCISEDNLWFLKMNYGWKGTQHQEKMYKTDNFISKEREREIFQVCGFTLVQFWNKINIFLSNLTFKLSTCPVMVIWSHWSLWLQHIGHIYLSEILSFLYPLSVSNRRRVQFSTSHVNHFAPWHIRFVPSVNQQCNYHRELCQTIFHKHNYILVIWCM